MRRLRLGMLVAAIAIGSAGPAWADATAFLGANTTPANRQVRGFSIGAGLALVAFEFEYARTSDDPLAAAPALWTGMGNLLLQTPIAILGFQPYFTAGGGLYNEKLGTHSHTGFAPNSGGGVKVNLAGPVRLRVDYRVFKLGSGALYSPAHRVYAGVNLKF